MNSVHEGIIDKRIKQVVDFIPAETKATWRTRARRGALEKLETLLEFRELLRDAKTEGYPPIMELYAEACIPMMCAAETLRRDMTTIREYDEWVLRHWLMNGLSFDHIDTANSLAEIAQKMPALLLYEATDPGNATGETMTVKELQAHALGGRSMPPVDFVFNRVFSILGKSPIRSNWDEEKTARFNDWLNEGKEFFK